MVIIILQRASIQGGAPYLGYKLSWIVTLLSRVHGKYIDHYRTGSCFLFNQY